MSKIALLVLSLSILVGIPVQANPFLQIRDERYINSSIFAVADRPHTAKCLVIPKFKNF